MYLITIMSDVPGRIVDRSGQTRDDPSVHGSWMTRACLIEHYSLKFPSGECNPLVPGSDSVRV